MSQSDAYTVVRSSRASRIAALAGIVVLIILAAAPLWAGRADMRLMSEIFLYLTLASRFHRLARVR